MYRSDDLILKADLALRKPSELKRCRSHGLLARQIDWRLVVFEGKVTFQFEIVAKTLNHLEINIVECCSARNEILRGLLMAHSGLDPLIAAQVVSKPRLPAFILAANPITKKLAVVGITLHLDYLPVLVTASDTAGMGGVSVNHFNSQVDLRDARKMRKVESRPECTVQRFENWSWSIVCF